jgi:uncharacterized protein (DUF952 family)
LRRIYKLLDKVDWAAARSSGAFTGSEVDIADGYIHFSTAEQAGETARRHFSGQGNLYLLTVDADALGEALRWEPSRGGALFPHLYGPLALAQVIDVRPLDLGADGVPDLGALEP